MFHSPRYLFTTTEPTYPVDIRVDIDINIDATEIVREIPRELHTNISSSSSPSSSVSSSRISRPRPTYIHHTPPTSSRLVSSRPFCLLLDTCLEPGSRFRFRLRPRYDANSVTYLDSARLLGCLSEVGGTRALDFVCDWDK